MARVSTRSVRFRVTALATMIVAVLLVTVAAALVVVQHGTLTAAMDDGLRRRADDLEAVVQNAIPATLVGVDDDTAAQLVTADGAVLVASPNLAGSGPIAQGSGDSGDTIAELEIVEPDDTFRVLSRKVDSVEGPLLLYVAAATDDVSDSVAILRNSLLLAIPLAVAALALTIWWLVGRALRPVEEIRAEVDSITESDLHHRVSVPNSNDEVERLAITMNRMLDRLESGVARLQRFVADASHELRSPLTRIRSELEVDLATDATDPVATHRSVLEEAVAMQQLVEDLLHLARSDAGGQPIRSDRVDLDDLVLAEADRLRTTTDVDVDVHGVSAGQVVGDRSQLERMVGNLADNAARYAEAKVTFSLEERDNDVVLTVADDGPGVAQAERERVFERFARTDQGRSRDEGGTGLGLAIVRDVVVGHGGSVRVDAQHRVGARFVVRLPRSGSVVRDEHTEYGADH